MPVSTMPPVFSIVIGRDEEIDLYFNEQVGSIDASSRFCVDLYTQCAYNDIKYGEAEVLANAKGTSIATMASHGVLYAKAGNVHLIERENLPTDVDTKHIPGHNNFQAGKSELTISMAEAGNLVQQYSGKGTPAGDNKERVDFGKTIGIYKDPSTGTSTPTTVGIIHYAKTGTHIVPARPKEN